MEERDAVIVGSRCAGATLAIALAERGWDVLIVDRDRFPSETVSTHLLYPNTLAWFEQLGVLSTLLSRHQLPLLQHRIRGLGHEISGAFTAIDGFDRCACPRRIVLDEAIVDTALAAGAEGRFGERVTGLIWAGSPDDPVAGVELDNGERIGAKWVFGADGRSSTVARGLGLGKRQELRGELAFGYAYWRGIPDDGFASLDIHQREMLNRVAIEDGLTMLIASGPPDQAKGSKEERLGKYLRTLHHFKETIEPDLLERGEMVSEVQVAPESLMRGFFREPTGPGWALVGDSCHFKHPGSAQGIGDAVEQALFVAEAVSGPSESLEGYERWLQERAAEHYHWSFSWGSFPGPAAEDLFRGWSTEPEAGQDLRDTFSRRIEPSELMTKERLARWTAAGGGGPVSTAPSASSAG